MVDQVTSTLYTLDTRQDRSDRRDSGQVCQKSSRDATRHRDKIAMPTPRDGQGGSWDFFIRRGEEREKALASRRRAEERRQGEEEEGKRRRSACCDPEDGAKGPRGPGLTSHPPYDISSPK
ncbi:hypothetical protein Taro_025844 [Colocasia esculenta]|uniref:Uncharacterized protein n=1 Tax=Colocasia esculenta TaxID=4460 RepID=A0A843VIS3_COLES|nr:hypothetical protein [Colocasia esculenta]